MVIYHAHCTDGFTSAWVASKALGFGEHVQYLDAQYGDTPPDVSGKEVYVLDFSYSRQEMKEMYLQAETLVVLDHHETSQEKLKGLPFAKFDMARCGASMAWAYFFPNEPEPDLIKYVEDGDLWRWALKDSQDVNLYLKSMPHDFETWSQLSLEKPSHMAIRGQTIKEFRDRQVEAIMVHAKFVNLFGVCVPIVQNTSKRLTSELLHRMAKDFPFAASWVLSGPRTVLFSFRSVEGGAHVGNFARGYGGGGHRHAGGLLYEASEQDIANIGQLVVDGGVWPVRTSYKDG